VGQEFTVWTSECQGSPHESRSFNGLRATRKLLCNWSDRLTLRDEIMAWPPPAYPHSPLAVMYPRGVGCEPYGKPGIVTVGEAPNDYQIMGYEYALVTVEYETPHGETPQPDPGETTDIISEIIEPTVEFAQLPNSKFFWQGTSPPVYLTADEAPGLQVEGLEYTFTRHHLSSAPSGVLDLGGKVNTAQLACKLLGWTFAAETLLLRMPRLEIVTNSAGAKRYTVSYRMSYNPHTWNKFPRYKAGDTSPTWAYLAVKDGDGSAYKPYPPADFSVL